MTGPITSAELAALVAEAAAVSREVLVERAVAAYARGVEQPRLFAQAVAAVKEAAGRTGLLHADLPEVWRRYGGLMAATGKLADARPPLELAALLAPDSAQAQADAGTICFMMADLAAARGHFERALAIKPDAATFAALAAIAARQKRFAAARELGEQALARDPAAPSAHIAIARADLGEGNVVAAEARLTERLAAGGLDPQNRVAMHDLRADAREASARHADAFADYAARNAILAEGARGRFAGPLVERFVARAERIAAEVEAMPATPWAAADGGAASRPALAFLVGFPRSGTTLLEKALAGHSAVLTLEEADHLGRVVDPWLAPGGLARLATAGAGELEAARAAYWSAVAGAAGVPLAGRTVIDKMPLNTIALPVIARLFPAAPILFAVRDPRDVVFSCFRRRFHLNAAMFELLTLDGAARLYDAVMRIGAASRVRLAQSLLEVRHETVVGAFVPEMTRVLALLGLGWEDSVADFATRAAARTVTPSDVQLASGLSAEGVGQWRLFADQLAPVQPVLAPWVERFGYAPG